MTVDQVNKLHKKAETRKDGVYSYEGVLWVVKNKHFIAFLEPNGDFLQRMGAFNALIGNLSTIEWKVDRRKRVIEWLKKQD